MIELGFPYIEPKKVLSEQIIFKSIAVHTRLYWRRVGWHRGVCNVGTFKGAHFT